MRHVSLRRCDKPITGWIVGSEIDLHKETAPAHLGGAEAALAAGGQPEEDGPLSLTAMRETVFGLALNSRFARPFGFAGQPQRSQAFPIFMERLLFAFMPGQGLSSIYFLKGFASLALGWGNNFTFKGVAHLVIP
jgi:hypothetical protein